MDLLTGTGLAASAGLNAWIPLLVVGLLARYTELLTLPAGWEWLTNGWVLAVLAVLLVVEVIADKIPVLDSANDVLQTLVRPASGGLVFGAGTSAETAGVTDPGAFLNGDQWKPMVAGIVVALAVHLLKAGVRPALNVMTAGLAAPVVSTAEDATSVTMALVAVLVPILVIGFLATLVGFAWWALRRRSKTRSRPKPALRHTRAQR